MTREFRLVETMPRRTYEAGRCRASAPEGLSCFLHLPYEASSETPVTVSPRLLGPRPQLASLNQILPLSKEASLVVTIILT